MLLPDGVALVVLMSGKDKVALVADHLTQTQTAIAHGIAACLSSDGRSYVLVTMAQVQDAIATIGDLFVS